MDAQGAIRYAQLALRGQYVTSNVGDQLRADPLRLTVLLTQLAADEPTNRVLHGNRIVAAILFQEAFMNERIDFRFV